MQPYYKAHVLQHYGQSYNALIIYIMHLLHAYEIILKLTTGLLKLHKKYFHTLHS